MPANFELRYFTGLMIVCLSTACATGSKQISQNMDLFCTAESGYQQGIEGAPYTGVCPDELAPAFLDGYQSGYAIHLVQMEVDAMERAVQAMSKDLANIGAEGETPELSARRNKLTAELDELEIELAFRKTQLLQMRHTIAAND